MKIISPFFDKSTIKKEKINPILFHWSLTQDSWPTLMNSEYIYIYIYTHTPSLIMFISNQIFLSKKKKKKNSNQMRAWDRAHWHVYIPFGFLISMEVYSTHKFLSHMSLTHYIRTRKTAHLPTSYISILIIWWLGDGDLSPYELSNKRQHSSSPFISPLWFGLH